MLLLLVPFIILPSVISTPQPAALQQCEERCVSVSIYLLPPDCIYRVFLSKVTKRI